MKKVLRMFAVAATVTVACASAGWAQNPQAVLSWGTGCPTVVSNANFSVGTFTLWVGIKNVTAADACVATDFNVFYGPGNGGPAFPDAWRVDDSGCQTASQVALNSNGNTKTCSPFKGGNILPITAFALDAAANKMNIRLANSFDVFTPTAGLTYTAWNVIFDHTFSVTGPGSPGATCGGAEVPMCFGISSQGDDPNFRSFVLTTGNVSEEFTFATPSEKYVTWNGGTPGGCPGSGVPAQPSTWGKIKGLYR